MKLFDEHNLPIPDFGKIIIYRSKSGFLYYKDHNARSEKLELVDSGIYRINKKVDSVTSYIQEKIDVVEGSEGILLHIYMISPVAISSGGGGGGRGVQGISGYSGNSGFSGYSGFSGVNGSGDNVTVQTLTDGATVTWDVSNGINAEVTITANRQLAIINPLEGRVYTIRVVQGGAGNFALALPASSKVINGGAGTITFTTTAGASDILTAYYDGTTYWWSYGNNYT